MNMRDLFPGYYRPTEEEFDTLWKECIFSFDTNILLHIYRYSPKTRKRFFDILQGLKERIWIPHQCAYEFHKNRLEVILSQKGAYKGVKELLDKHLNTGKLQEELYKQYKRHPVIEVKKILENLNQTINEIKNNLDNQKQSHPDLLEDDEFREELINILESRVGEPYSPDELKQIYRNAEQRFKDLIPPGYEDGKDKKGLEKFGDTIIWLQLIKYAQSNKKSIIFVTDDDKEDWWIKNDRNIIEPRPELVQEMANEAGVKFYLYPGDRFLKRASEFLKLTEQPEVIKEAREVREQNIESQTLLTEQTLINKRINKRILELQLKNIAKKQHSLQKDMNNLRLTGSFISISDDRIITKQKIEEELTSLEMLKIEIEEKLSALE